MTIGWSSDLATGVADIDRQHKEIFDRVERLSAACSEGKGKDEVLRLLLFLEDYVKEHFAAEERLQLKHAYPEYVSHKAQHAQFVRDVSRLETALKEEGATLSLVIMTNKTLVSWLVQHIAKADREFTWFLRGEKGA